MTNGQHDVDIATLKSRVDSMDRRLAERREAEIQLFKELAGIHKEISAFREDFAGWRGRVVVWGGLVLVLVTVVVNVGVRTLF